MTYFSTGLRADHDLSRFDCGKDVLNKWLQTKALAADTGMTSRTYVWTDGDALVVKAYYAIAPTMVDRTEDGISNRMAAGMRSVPAFLLAKFALDKSLHGQGYGSDLLVDAISKIMGAAQASGGRLIVVDAIDDEASAFYQKHDFIPVGNTPGRLVMKMSTAFSAFGIG
ncbi:GNAT family N-acetyltransferase [Nocardia shimofusensis]|uniref:GNAT family N-acetyltransferase n=1 Tax=Nocardia shimofusensis TaxID=228596 RepID=UPI000833B71B|nr:GNAT family N-acetyltransferase [Nocardia shimofusensis]